MSGHSKWATTKHKKAAIDAKRGKLFAKLIKNIEVAARQGGGDLAGNPTLFDAIQKAKKQSVPNKNIDSAVKRGGGLEGGGVDYETIMYEVYGPQGVALRFRRQHSLRDVASAAGLGGQDPADEVERPLQPGLAVDPARQGLEEQAHERRYPSEAERDDRVDQALVLADRSALQASERTASIPVQCAPSR